MISEIDALRGEIIGHVPESGPDTAGFIGMLANLKLLWELAQKLPALMPLVQELWAKIRTLWGEFRKAMPAPVPPTNG